MGLAIDSSSLSISSLSKEFIKVKVRGVLSGSEVDPTGFTVEFAFTTKANPATEPEASDWSAGTWETVNGTYLARALVGPGTSFVLSNGDYDIWIRFDDNTEFPVRHVGSLKVT